MTVPFPTSAHELTVASLTALVHTMRPDVTVDAFKVVESHHFGDGKVSTAARMLLDIDYAGETDLPKRVVLKVARPDLMAYPLYANEVAFYTLLRPELTIETPVCVGSTFDRATGTFGLAMEDLRERGATFSSVEAPVTVDQLHSLLALTASVHARFWDSPRFAEDLSWVQSHVAGELPTVFNRVAPAMIVQEIAANQFKRELVASIGQTAESLLDQTQRLQRHQSMLPSTLVHGDLHIGNTYLLPNGQGGLVDWQLTSRGYCMHDVAYLIITGLPVDERRKHERDLLAFYREQLRAAGVTDVPDTDTTWLDYRRAAVWGLYIGWLTTPIENYGWAINVTNHIRLATAYRDLETAAALADLPPL